MRKFLIKKEVKKLLKQLDHTVTLDSIIEKSGCTIFCYNNRNLIGDEMLAAVGEKSYARKVNAFSLIEGEQRFIFLKNSLSDEAKLFHSLHELGHLRLGHNRHKISNYYNNIQCEEDANSFADAVLNHKLHHANQQKLVFATVASLLILLIVFYQGFIHNFCFISRAGDCYHIGCNYLKKKSSITWLTIKKAEEMDFRPCKRCYPEKYENLDI